MSNDDRNKKDRSLEFEKFYPYAFALLIAILGVLCLILNVKIIDDIDTILNATISFVSIILGFLGALIALIFSLDNNPIVNYIFRNKHYKSLMKCYFKVSINSGFIAILITVIMFFRNTIRNIGFLNINFDLLIDIIKIVWIYYVVLFSLSSYRMINIILKISFTSKEDIEQGEDESELHVQQIEEDIEQMKKNIELAED